MSERSRGGFSLKSSVGNRLRPAPRLSVERLEDRLVPSGVPTVDLTAPGAAGEINGAIFYQASTQPTGTGVIDSFVRIQGRGNQAITQGYNTSVRPLQFDENKSPQFTRALQLNELPTVNAGGTTFRVFLLDINQKSSQPLLSLDEVSLYVSGSAGLSGYNPTAHTLGGLAPVYDMDAGADNWVKLDAGLNHGSGSGDMLMYVPDAAFTGGVAGANPYVTLYTKFGVNDASNGGFEEWAPGAAVVPPVTVQTGTISGTVYLNGLPQAGVTVSVVLASGQIDSATTCSDGTYKLTGVPIDDSTYTVNAQFIDASGQRETGQSSPVTVSGLTQTGVDVNLYSSQGV